jgi:membrane protein
LKRAFVSAYQDVVQHHVLLQAAALSYYLVLSVFPGLIFLAAILGSMPLPDLFGHVLGFLGQVLPADTMRAVRAVLLDVLATNRTAWLSLGTIGTIWTTSAAFDAMIESLDLAYDVEETRPFWKTRLLAIGLAGLTGALVLTAVIVMIVGPRLGGGLAEALHLSRVFVLLWPFIHWTVAILFSLVAVELMYFLAPNVKQRFGATLPGAMLALGAWIAFSYLLGFYFRHVANFSRTYGTLAGFIAFMTWFYWNSFALLVGAELNAELAKESRKGQLPAKEQPISRHKLGRRAA